MAAGTLSTPKAASELLRRRAIRSSLREWAVYRREKFGQKPALHHLVLLELVQRAVDQELVHPTTGDPCANLMVLMPPGVAKSTYISMDTPPWYLQRKPQSRILACSYSSDLIESFSRDCRNTVLSESKVLGYTLTADSRSVQEWNTTNGGGYRCLGVGAGISGRRGDLGYIDDYLGTEEDADSKTIRDKQWVWYNGDFWPRLKPAAVQIIVANRRHEDDLVGRILEREEKSWVVVKIPFFASEDDPLGRTKVDRVSHLGHLDLQDMTAEDICKDPKARIFLDSRIWPEYMTRLQAAKVLQLPARTQAGLYNQNPAPEEGDYFKREWLTGYTREDYDNLMKTNPRIYGAGDWALSEERNANKSCFGGVAVDYTGMIYVLPDIFWRAAGPKQVVTEFLAFLRRREPDIFWSEKGHITQAWGPFVKEMMVDERIFSYIKEHVPSKNKETRARSIQGRMSMLRVRFPKFASWWPDAEHELLHFPGGKSDDFCDFLAHIGLGLGSIIKPQKQTEPDKEDLNQPFKPTLSWLKQLDAERRAKQAARYNGR